MNAAKSPSKALALNLLISALTWTPVISLHAQSASTQPQHYYGQVVDKATGKPLLRARVSLFFEPERPPFWVLLYSDAPIYVAEVQTDRNGRFDLHYSPNRKWKNPYLVVIHPASKLKAADLLQTSNTTTSQATLYEEEYQRRRIQSYDHLKINNPNELIFPKDD